MNPAQPFRAFCVSLKVARELRARIEARDETQAEAIAEYLYRFRHDGHFEATSEQIFDCDVTDWEARS